MYQKVCCIQLSDKGSFCGFIVKNRYGSRGGRSICMITLSGICDELISYGEITEWVIIKKLKSVRQKFRLAIPPIDIGILIRPDA